MLRGAPKGNVRPVTRKPLARESHPPEAPGTQPECRLSFRAVATNAHGPKELRRFSFALLGLLALAPLSEAQTNRPSGAVVSWGNRWTPYVEPGTRFTAIAAGYDHTVALTSDGSVVAWGGNKSGQAIVPVAAKSGVVAIAAGDSHTVALKSDGSVLAWGANGYGEANVPVAAKSGVVAIAGGGQHTVALKSDGSVLAWGANDNGQRNVPVAAKSGVVAIAAEGVCTLALKNDGSVLAWGDNQSGQTDVPSEAQSGVVAIAGGGEFHDGA